MDYHRVKGCPRRSGMTRFASRVGPARQERDRGGEAVIRLGLMDLQPRPRNSSAGLTVTFDGLEVNVRHLGPDEEATIPGGGAACLTLVISGAAALVTDGWHVELLPLQFRLQR